MIPALATAVMLAIGGQDANAVTTSPSGTVSPRSRAADVFRAVVGYGKRPNACYMDARPAAAGGPEMGRAPVGSRTTIGGLRSGPRG